jgi:tight adherence protein B
MGLLLALIFATGVGLIWLGAVMDVQVSLPESAGRLDALLADTGIGLSPCTFLGAIVICGTVTGLVTWWAIEVPALVLVAVAGGALTPISWARSKRGQRARERERAWPAVLSQLADGLEAGLAFPAVVSLIATSGPQALRAEFAAFAARLRSSDIDAAIEGLRGAGERTSDSVALLLRAAIAELPTGGLSPVLRELSQVLSERLEAREKARSRAHTMHVEAAILAVSPVAILLLIGAVSPGYLNAYRSAAGTVVLLLGAALIFGCYLLMRRLGRVPEPRRTAKEGGS